LSEDDLIIEEYEEAFNIIYIHSIKIAKALQNPVGYSLLLLFQDK